ncbi:MAG: tetratricopeptide repeat protein [Nitrososphaera sp.]|nr:tetratricopeptide repeat protein [Nitrososphaera sp.]
MTLESQPQEHFITLPLVSKKEESTRLPLVINVVAKYWGEDIAPEEGEVEKVSPKGSVLIEGIELAESRGFTAFIYRGSIKDLKKRIDQGIPPIVIMPGMQAIVQHATIVCGYSNDERRILTYVPEPDTVGAIPENRFENDWVQDDLTTIIIVPDDMKDLFRNERLQFKESNRLCFEAERLRQQGGAEAAIIKLRKATEIDPDNPQAWCLLGGIYNETGSDQALPCYERAISFNPRYYLAYRGLGNLYLKKQNYSQAEGYYTKAIDINPGRFGTVYKNRAISRMELGNAGGAKEDLANYLKQMPAAEDRKLIEEALLQL